MNLETRDLLRILEQATSPADVDLGTMDEETALLRESWLALGQMLDESEHPSSPIPTLQIPLAPTKRVPSRRFRFGWMLTCATVLLAIICSGWYFVAGLATFHGAVNSVAGGGAFRDFTDHATSGNEMAPTLGSESVVSSQSGLELAWDDAFDDQLARTGYAIWQARGAASNQNQAWEHLFNELQLISNDLEGESL